MATAQCGFKDMPGKSGANSLATYGPTLFVNIGFDPTYKIGSIPRPGITNLEALVDTGASESCIDSLLATQLKLPIIDRKPISGTIGAHFTNIYLAQIYVPSLSFTIYGSFAGVNLKAGGQVHSALIGRSFLINFSMIYEGKKGTVTISST